MNRREFLQNSLLSVAAVGLFSKFSLAKVSDEPKEITIVGAGLAGLVAAFELNKLGHDVTILEAQLRAGGRVLTVRDFPENLYAEAGAARINYRHDLTHRYIREFGLELLPFYPAKGKFQRFYDNKAETVDWNGFAEANEFVITLEKQDDWKKIKGGNDSLPTAFAAKLKDKIKYNAPVAKIEQNDKIVAATFVENGRQQVLNGDFLISAIPFTMLRKVEIAPKFSDAKTEIIQKLAYDSASRIFLQTKKRFWLDKGLNGFASGENFAEIWDSTFGEAGTHGILQSYIRGFISDSMMAGKTDERIETIVKSVERLFPELRANFEKGYAKCWIEDEWVRGAWAHSTPQQLQIITTLENRIFFAGEHASNAPGWMQGALSSGLRVVQEIANAASAQKV